MFQGTVWHWYKTSIIHLFFIIFFRYVDEEVEESESEDEKENCHSSPERQSIAKVITIISIWRGLLSFLASE